MYYLIYISTALNLMDQQELTDLLTQSREKNSHNNITGALLYSQGTFIQALEGDEETVNEIYTTILQDSRHKNIITVISGELKERVFPDWSMAFIALDPDKMTELEGYINPLKTQLFKGGYNNPAITVMKTFAENNNLNFS